MPCRQTLQPRRADEQTDKATTTHQYTVRIKLPTETPITTSNSRPTIPTIATMPTLATVLPQGRLLRLGLSFLIPVYYPNVMSLYRPSNTGIQYLAFFLLAHAYCMVRHGPHAIVVTVGLTHWLLAANVAVFLYTLFFLGLGAEALVASADVLQPAWGGYVAGELHYALVAGVVEVFAARWCAVVEEQMKKDHEEAMDVARKDGERERLIKAEMKEKAEKVAAERRAREMAALEDMKERESV